jgi:hypothetical protein
VLFAFGDLVTDLDFAELAARHGGGADALLASHHEAHRLQLGELVVAGERVVGYREKPEKRFLICSGIGMFRREALRALPADGRPRGLVDLVTAILDRGLTVAHWEHGAFWMDVNSPELLREATRRLSARAAGAGADPAGADPSRRTGTVDDGLEPLIVCEQPGHDRGAAARVEDEGAGRAQGLGRDRPVAREHERRVGQRWHLGRSASAATRGTGTPSTAKAGTREST